MRALDAEVHDPESLSQRRGDRGIAHGLVHASPPHATDGWHHAHDDMERVMRLDRLTLLVRRACTLGFRLAPGALAFATVAKQFLLHMPLARPPRPRRF